MIVPNEREPVPPQSVQLERVLLVEGDTPTHFFEAILRTLGMSDRIEIRNYGGITQLGAFLKTLASTADFKRKVKSLGIVRDAEDDPVTARQSVDGAIRRAGLSEDVAVSVAILPDERTPGMIETLCVRSIESDPAYECVSQFFACLDRKVISLPGGIHRAKHIAHVFLAAKDCPQMFPGTAAYRGAWPFSSAVFDNLKDFLTKL